MFGAVTDHVFIDGGHTLDFTNKAFEALDHVGAARPRRAPDARAARPTAAARAEETFPWRHPHDLVALARRHAPRARGRAYDDVAGAGMEVARRRPARPLSPRSSMREARCRAPSSSAARSRYAAALRITRFHVQNDFGDWDQVHHAFTAANALHQALVRNPTPELMRGIVQGALRVYLDRFLNVPAARLPSDTTGDLAELAACWDAQGEVDRAGAIVLGYLRGGGDRAEWSPRSVTRCSPKTPGSTGTRCSKRASARRPRGRRDRRRRAHPRRDRPVPRRAHADPSGAPDRRAARDPAPPRRSAPYGVTGSRSPFTDPPASVKRGNPSSLLWNRGNSSYARDVPSVNRSIRHSARWSIEWPWPHSFGGTVPAADAKKTTSSRKTTAMTDAHKKALAVGREQGRVIRGLPRGARLDSTEAGS